MDQEKLKVIREYVKEYEEILTGHWSENDKQMLHDLLEGYEELLAENEQLKKDLKVFESLKNLSRFIMNDVTTALIKMDEEFNGAK